MNRLFLLPFVILVCSCSLASSPPLPTVKKVDLSRYAGTWYEVASVANRFQRGCAATKAEYELQPDQTVRIRNSCREETLSGKERTIGGTAWVVNPETNAELTVRFVWPFTGDYNILELGPDYDYALVGTKSRKYFWILSRTTTLDESIVTRLIERARELGFDAGAVKRTLQPAG